MFIKKKNYKLLDKSIEDLSSTLEKANIKEIAYILGNKKEIIKQIAKDRNVNKNEIYMKFL